MERSSLGIVIPAFNESRTIAYVVDQCNAYGRSIVVDDGSSDATGDMARAAGAQVVRHGVNRGYDAALESGFQQAAKLGCKYVITIDADGQHDPTLLAKFCNLLDSGADIVIGNRNERPRLAESCFSLLTELRYGMKDPLCGLKAYRMSIYNRLGHFDSYDSIGTELALFAVRNGFRMEQVPLIVRDRVDAPRFGRRLRANYKILRAMLLSMLPY
jgi:glycosyltransferase involved in cell wall biosynthesis